MSQELQLATVLAQAGINADQRTGSLTAPLYFSTTYQHPEFGKSTGYDYTRTKNPTRTCLEESMAKIEQAQYALATSSGMSAIILAFSIFSVGTKVLAVRDLYGGSFRWFQQMEDEGRFHFTFAQTEKELIQLLTDEIDLVYLETPTNPLMEEFTIATIAKAAHQHGARVIVDNTFYSPIYQQPLTEGADLVLHSATKYLSGHNDVLAGVVLVNDQAIYEQLFYQLNTTGAVLSPFDSYLLLRGLKTLDLRMERSTQNAQKIARFLQESPMIKEVFYPGKGGMISFKVTQKEKIPKIINTLKLITFAESLGGVESLITYPETQTHADIPVETRRAYGLTDDLLRLSVGIEDSQDLINDLKEAFEVAYGTI